MKIKRIFVKVHLNHWDILPYTHKEKWGSDDAVRYLVAFLCFWFAIVIRWKK